MFSRYFLYLNDSIDLQNYNCNNIILPPKDSPNVDKLRTCHVCDDSFSNYLCSDDNLIISIPDLGETNSPHLIYPTKYFDSHNMYDRKYDLLTVWVKADAHTIDVRDYLFSYNNLVQQFYESVDSINSYFWTKHNSAFELSNEIVFAYHPFHSYNHFHIHVFNGNDIEMEDGLIFTHYEYCVLTHFIDLISKLMRYMNGNPFILDYACKGPFSALYVPFIYSDNPIMIAVHLVASCIYALGVVPSFMLYDISPNIFPKVHENLASIYRRIIYIAANFQDLLSQYAKDVPLGQYFLPLWYEKIYSNFDKCDRDKFGHIHGFEVSDTMCEIIFGYARKLTSGLVWHSRNFNYRELSNITYHKHAVKHQIIKHMERFPLFREYCRNNVVTKEIGIDSINEYIVQLRDLRDIQSVGGNLTFNDLCKFWKVFNSR
jgi:hypothetical protein